MGIQNSQKNKPKMYPRNTFDIVCRYFGLLEIYVQKQFTLVVIKSQKNLTRYHTRKSGHTGVGANS